MSWHHLGGFERWSEHVQTAVAGVAGAGLGDGDPLIAMGLGGTGPAGFADAVVVGAAMNGQLVASGLVGCGSCFLGCILGALVFLLWQLGS